MVGNKLLKLVVDFVKSLPEANSKIALFGYSPGGYLAIRAAAFKLRFDAAITSDSVSNLASFVALPDDVSTLCETEEKDESRKFFDKMCTST